MTDENVTIPQDSEPTVGQQLKLAREAKNLSIEAVAAQTRMTRATLRNLENMTTGELSPTFARMQARSYASFLGFETYELSDIENAYAPDRAVAAVGDFPSSKIEVEKTGMSARAIWPAAIAAAVVTAGLIGVLGLQGTSESRAELPVNRQVATSQTAALETNRAEGALKRELSLRAVKTAWVEVRGSDGTIFRNRVMSSGEAYYPRTNAGWTVTMRDAGAFEWWLGDMKIAPAGEPGQSIYSANVDEALAESEDILETALAARTADNPSR